MMAVNPLVPLGVGIALGGCALWRIIEMWPVLVIGGGIILALTGVKKSE
jgi:hypothetical protein